MTARQLARTQNSANLSVLTTRMISPNIDLAAILPGAITTSVTQAKRWGTIPDTEQQNLYFISSEMQ